MTVRRIVTLVLVLSLCFGQAAVAATGDTISMSFTNVPVGYLFQNIGRMYGVSFSISAAAAAKTVSVELTDVNFEQALDMISQSAGVKIAKAAEGLYIVRAAEEETEGVSKEEKAKKEQEDRLNNAVMEAVTTKFVNADDIQTALDELFGEEFDSLVSISKLSEEEDRNYNSVVIYASTPQIMETVKKVIQQIDRPKPLVEIEALFVELTITDNKQIGVDWNPMTNPLKFQEEAPAQNPENDPMKYYTSRFGQFWRVSPWEMEATLQALSGSGHGRVLADPKVRVMSGRKAMFVSETQMPILTKDSEDDINTEWKNIGISLEILPVVLDDGTIYMDVIPKASAIVGEKRLGDVTAPIISERRVETEMLLKPDETIVIGGLINDRDIKNMSKVPILGDIPLFGELFRSTRTEIEKSTVIVFLRPKIIEDYMGANIPQDIRANWEKSTAEVVPTKKPEEILSKLRQEIEQDKPAEPVPVKPQEPVEQDKSAEPISVKPEELQEKTVSSEKPVVENETVEQQQEKVNKPKHSDEEYEAKWKALLEQYKESPAKTDESVQEQKGQDESVKQDVQDKQPEEKKAEPAKEDVQETEQENKQEQQNDQEEWTPPVK